MWQQQFSTTTTLPKEKIWKVLSDIENWHKWDDEIEYTKLNGEAKAGTNFVLKPKGAPKVTLTIEEFSPSSRFVDLTNFPLAKMRTIHELVETSSGTSINVTILTMSHSGVGAKPLPYIGLALPTSALASIIRGHADLRRTYV